VDTDVSVCLDRKRKKGKRERERERGGGNKKRRVWQNAFLAPSWRKREWIATNDKEANGVRRGEKRGAGR